MEELTFCVGFPFLRFTLVLTITILLKDIDICYAGFTLYTSNMYTCKYAYFRKDILKDIQLHV